MFGFMPACMFQEGSRVGFKVSGAGLSAWIMGRPGITPRKDLVVEGGWELSGLRSLACQLQSLKLSE